MRTASKIVIAEIRLNGVAFREIITGRYKGNMTILIADIK